MSAIEYLESVQSALKGALEEQLDAIHAAADLWAAAIAGGGLVHLFGSGHSSLVCQDAYSRAGGLVPVNWIMGEDLLPLRGLRSSMVERLPGLAAVLLDFEPLRVGDVLVVVSNSGRNAVPVEMAEVGRERGLRTIAITSLRHSQSCSSRAPSGKRLCEVADLVLDNMAARGDAAISIGEGDDNVTMGATSTVTGCAILQAISLETAERLIRQGIRPPVFRSANLDNSEELNLKLLLSLDERVPSLMAADINRLSHVV